MQWIEEVQRSLGAPVVAFAQANWLILLIIGAVAMLWFFGGFTGRRADGSISAFLVFGVGDDSSDSDGDSGDDGGGGDGGGGGD